MTNIEIQNITSESLRDWFKKEKWVRITTSGNIAGPCGTSKNKKNPDRCLPKAKAQSLSKAERAATARKKKAAGKKGKTVVSNTKKAKVTREMKEQWPQGTQSRYQEYSFKLLKVMPDRAKYAVTDMETGKLKGTVVFNTVDQLHDYAADLVKPLGGRQSSHFGTQESKVTKEDIKNLVVGLIHEMQNEKALSSKEQQVVDDILSGLNEGALSGVVNKMKQYAKKGLLTLAVLASVTQGLQAQGVSQSDIDAVNQQGIELVQQDSTVSRMTERLIVQNLGQQKFDAFVKLAKENGLRLGAGKSRSLSMAQSQSRLNALLGINGEVTTQIVDSKTMKTSDGQYLVIQFIQVNVQENTIMEKDDRCTRLAKQKYDTWPSAYASGAVVRCRRGEIWKKK